MTNVILGCIYMSHVQSQRYPEGRAAQPCSRFFASQRARHGGLRTRANLHHLPPASVSVSQASATPEGSGPGRGCKGRLYCQAVSKFGREAPGLCFHDRSYIERHCQPCCCEVIEPRNETWLNDRRLVSAPFGWNTGLIACWPKNSRTFMSCWRRNGAEWRIAAQPVVRRC